MAVATGVKRSDPENHVVFTYQGDGDLASIGMAETVHAAARNENITIIFGGQGILFAGKFLAYKGLMDDKQVSWLPSYGPEMRGGTASCSIILRCAGCDESAFFG